MKRNCKTSLALSESMLALVNHLASEENCSRSEFFNRLILDRALRGPFCGPISKMLELSEKNQDMILNEILEKVKK